MQYESIDDFLRYFERIRQRTLRIIQYIPKDKLEWTYKEGKFTLGDLVRHLAAIERYMYAENARFLPSRYAGCGPELADGYEAVMTMFRDLHLESMDIFRKVRDDDLFRKTVTPGGAEIALWKWLRSMIEHEVHHRGQIYLYLSMLDVQTPPLYGLTSEEVAARARR